MFLTQLLQKLLKNFSVQDRDNNLTAILGPTNTGKTYAAFERLISYKSGIFGFPLRLLARENYDKAVDVMKQIAENANMEANWLNMIELSNIDDYPDLDYGFDHMNQF